MKKTIILFTIFILFFEMKAQEDSLKTYKLEEIRVSSGEIIQPKSVKILEFEKIREMDVARISDIYKSLPSIKKQTNSRGETLFYLRGFGERHLSLYLDDVLLNIPWDYRIDLSLIPALGIEKFSLTKGIPSVIYGPNNLGGVINAYSFENISGRKANLRFLTGTNDLKSADLMFSTGNAQRSFLAALSFNEEGDYRLSDDFEPNFDNPTNYRKNSSKKSYSGFTKFNLKVLKRFRTEVSLSFYSSEKNVPYEINDPKPRYWKYPLWERFSISNNGKLFIGDKKNSMLIYSVGFSNFKMHIKQYDDNNYSLIDKEEFDHDKTITSRVLYNWFFGKEDNLKIAYNGLYTNHSEVILSEQRNYSEYSEFLFSIGSEVEKKLNKLKFILGTGLDGLITPELGDNPEKDPDYELSFNSSVIYNLNENTVAKLNYGRKTRYPSLREAYSEALGKFEINKNLKPETANTIEFNFEKKMENFNWDINLFYTHLRDGITKTRLPNKKYLRINKDEVRNIGLEFTCEWFNKNDNVIVNFTYMKSRSKNSSGEFKDTLEYKPEIIINSNITHKFCNSFSVSAELSFLGSEFAENPIGNGFVRLPDYFLANIRLNKKFSFNNFQTDLFLRVDNLFDKLYYSQINLPEAGRKFIIGFNFNL